MSITIGAASFPTLTAQPFGYDETNVRAGRTARKWLVTGLLKPSEWLSLLSAYDGWRNTRINDAPSIESGVVGTTIAFSGTGPGGQTWSNVACWVSVAPSAEQVGAYLSASIELVDAAQALEVLLKEQEDSETESLPDLGTITLGTAVLTLLKPKETYAQGPQLELTATGVHYVTGPLVVYRIWDVEGTTDAAGWTAVQAWYEAQIVAVPSPTSWFPISAPSATAENKVVGGVTTVQYTVSVQLGQVI